MTTEKLLRHANSTELIFRTLSLFGLIELITLLNEVSSVKISNLCL